MTESSHTTPTEAPKDDGSFEETYYDDKRGLVETLFSCDGVSVSKRYDADGGVEEKDIATSNGSIVRRYDENGVMTAQMIVNKNTGRVTNHLYVAGGLIAWTSKNLDPDEKPTPERPNCYVSYANGIVGVSSYIDNSNSVFKVESPSEQVEQYEQFKKSIPGLPDADKIKLQAPTRKLGIGTQ